SPHPHLLHFSLHDALPISTLLDALPALELISVFGVGYDGVPVDYCRKRGIKVSNTPDVLTDDVADVAVGLILMTGRGFVRANRRSEEHTSELQSPYDLVCR